MVIECVISHPGSLQSTHPKQGLLIDPSLIRAPERSAQGANDNGSAP